MIKIGITGGIGSGKSTVSAVWKELGAYVMYADDVAKKLMVTNDDVISQIKAEFGDESYHKDGTLNKPYLAEEAFKKGRVEQLNKIVHPAVYEETQRVMKLAESEAYSLFVKEAALLLKHGKPTEFDYIVLVLADLEKRLKRVVSRDNSEEQEVESRMRAQQDFENLQHLADYTILNNGTLEDLKTKAKSLFNLWVNADKN